MKKIYLVAAIASVLSISSVAQAEGEPVVKTDTKKAQATATWSATAIKDTKSALVVTPLKSLTFNYAEKQRSFNQQDGAFDIAVQGPKGTDVDFKLTAQVLTNTLSRTTDKEILTVGVNWLGKAVSATESTTLLDTSATSAGANAGLDILANGDYNSGERIIDRGKFSFNIESASVDGTETAFNELTDGVWDGDVQVVFNATWNGNFTPAETPVP